MNLRNEDGKLSRDDENYILVERWRKKEFKNKEIKEWQEKNLFFVESVTLPAIIPSIALINFTFREIGFYNFKFDPSKKSWEEQLVEPDICPTHPSCSMLNIKFNHSDREWIYFCVIYYIRSQSCYRDYFDPHMDWGVGNDIYEVYLQE